jgi:hypothetical protein
VAHFVNFDNHDLKTASFFRRSNAFGTATPLLSINDMVELAAAAVGSTGAAGRGGGTWEEGAGVPIAIDDETALTLSALLVIAVIIALNVWSATVCAFSASVFAVCIVIVITDFRKYPATIATYRQFLSEKSRGGRLRTKSVIYPSWFVTSLRATIQRE